MTALHTAVTAMLTIHHQPPGGLTRRELLHVGGLGLLGLSALDLARLRALSPVQRRQKNSCVFFFLFGGPSHIDLWDMKPDAPAEVRGEFRSIATCVPGIRVCEHLPLLARHLDKVCLLRSMTHHMNVHGPACSEIFTGREYFAPPTTDQARREDWPSLSSLVMRHAAWRARSREGREWRARSRQGREWRSRQGREGLPPSVVLPWYLQFPGQPRRIAGQTGGRMGERYNAYLLQGDLGKADFEFEGLQLREGLPIDRLRQRRQLLARLEMPLLTPGESFDTSRDGVYSLLEGKAGEVFDLRREPVAIRERYGLTTVGQSLLLARRLVEAGVSLVTVNWQDETKIDGVNTCWDTHQDNFPKLKTLLAPLFDRAFTAFLSDLHTRGLLATTLVVAIGEFGRTPKLGEFTQSTNTRKTGRDHWPHAFTALLAGGGVRGGQVYGSTTSNGGYVKDRPVTPADLSATILHHLGIDFTLEYEDEFQRLRNRLSIGTPVKDLG